MKEKKCEARRDRILRSFPPAPASSYARNLADAPTKHPMDPARIGPHPVKDPEEELSRWARSPRRAAPPLLVQQAIQFAQIFTE